MTDCEISILTNLELNRLIDYAFKMYGNTNNIIFGAIDYETNEIKIGKLLSANLAITYLSHELTHKALYDLIDKKTAHNLDNLYYFDFKTNQRLKELFSFDGLELI